MTATPMAQRLTGTRSLLALVVGVVTALAALAEEVVRALARRRGPASLGVKASA